MHQQHHFIWCWEQCNHVHMAVMANTIHHGAYFMDHENSYTLVGAGLIIGMACVGGMHG